MSTPAEVERRPRDVPQRDGGHFVLSNSSTNPLGATRSPPAPFPRLREGFAEAFLWLSVLAWATWFGGTLYQMVVVVPMWHSGAPESVRWFFQATNYNQTIFDFFGPPFMALRTAPVAIALALSWRSPRDRRLLGAALLLILAAIVYTIYYVYPINDPLFYQACADCSDERVIALCDRWILADRLRFLGVSIAFVLILRCFRRR